MKNYLGLAAVSVLAAAAIVGVACTASADNGSPQIFNVTESGQQIELSPGDSLVVTLDSNPSTGFAWSIVAISDEGIMDDVSNEFVGAETGMVGAGGQEIWTFEALDEGTITIEMQYSRSWETGLEPAESFTVTVIVK